MLVYVASLKMAKEVWDTLKSLLETQGALGIVQAQWKLFQSKCEEDMPIEEHIWTLHGYQEELHNLGKRLMGRNSP